MRASTIFATAASMASLASARITGFTIPKTVAPGDTIDLTLIGENYIQSSNEVSFAYGVSDGPNPNGQPGQLGGKFAGSTYTAEYTNKAENFTVPVTIPEAATKGPAIFNAIATQIYGVDYFPTLVAFNVSIEVADTTSEEVIRSNYGLGSAYW